MAEYKLELSESIARLQCTCCAAGMTSICGFIRREGRPYAMYYALVHNNREHKFVRLSMSLGSGWQKKSYDDRLALCLDLLPQGAECAISVQDASASPQHTFLAFGHWLDRAEAKEHPALQKFVEMARFIVKHDPALSSYLSGGEIDFSGRNRGNGTGD